MAIEIKTALKDFHETSIQQARHYIQYLLNEGLPNIKSYDKKLEYIEKKRLRGISVYELLDIKPDNENGTKKIAVVQLTKDGKFIARYNSINDARKATGADNPGITAVCRGDRLSAGGYRWMYLDEYLKQGSEGAQI